MKCPSCGKSLVSLSDDEEILYCDICNKKYDDGFEVEVSTNGHVDLGEDEEDND